MRHDLLPVSGSNGDIHIPLPRQHHGEPAPEVARTEAPVAPAVPAEPTTGRDGRWAIRLAWAAPALVMLAFGLIGINNAGLWSDELATWGMTTISWGEFWRQLGSTDATLGAYYIFMRLWTTILGDSDVALRLPSVLAMAGAAAMVGLIGLRAHSARAGLLAGLILPLIPISVRYAQEARPYAFAILLAALATLMLVRLLDEGPTTINIIGYIAAVASMGFFHLVSLILLAGHALAAYIIWPQFFRRWVLLAGLGALPVIPLVIAGTRQTGQIDWIPLARADQLLDYGYAFFGPAIIGGAVLALGFAGLRRDRGSLIAAGTAIVPTALLFLIGTVGHIWQHRYLLFTLVGWALLVGFMLVRQHVYAAFGALALIAVMSLPGQIDMRQPDVRLQDTRAVAALLTAEVQPGDGIIYGLDDRGPGVLNRDILTHYLPQDRQPKDLLIDRPMRTDGWLVASEYADVANRVAGVRRIWVLRIGEYSDPLEELGASKTEVLRSQYSVTKTWRTAGLTLALLTQRSQP